jgi:hypothetical protein
MGARIHRLGSRWRALVWLGVNRACTRKLTCSLFALMFVPGCSPLSPAKLNPSENGPGMYSISTVYYGSWRAEEEASEWLDIDAKNLCGSPYKLISKKTSSNMNHLGEVTSSRLMWIVSCERPPEESP